MKFFLDAIFLEFCIHDSKVWKMALKMMVLNGFAYANEGNILIFFRNREAPKLSRMANLQSGLQRNLHMASISVSTSGSLNNRIRN